MVENLGQACRLSLLCTSKVENRGQGAKNAHRFKKDGIDLRDEQREGGGEADEGPEAHDVEVRHPPEVGVLRRRDKAHQPDPIPIVRSRCLRTIFT